MPRGYRYAILTALVGIGALGSCTNTQLNTDRSQQPDQRSDPQKERYAALAADPAFAAYPYKDADTCYNAKTHDSADLCAQWRAAVAAEEAVDAAKRANFLSIVGAILTVVGLAFIYTTFRETKRTAEAAVSGVKEAQRAADAAHQANLEMRYSQRAWMSHKGVYLGLVHDDDGNIIRLEAHLEWVNAGPTPARDCLIRGASPILQGKGVPQKSDFDKFRPELDALDGGQPMQLGPNCPVNSHTMFFDKAVLQSILEKRIAVYLWSAIDYFDIFSDDLRRSEVMIELRLRADPKTPHDLRRLEMPETVVSGPYNFMT